MTCEKEESKEKHEEKMSKYRGQKVHGQIRRCS